MKKLLLLFCVVFTTSQVFSQVFWEKRPTSFANSRGVAKISIANANDIWLEAYDGTTPTNQIFEFAKSSDGGETWTNGPIAVGAATGDAATTVCSLKAISSSTCFVGIANGSNPGLAGLYKTTDGGVSWVKKTTGYFNGSTSFFDFGAFFTDQIGIAVGDPLGGYMEVYRTLDGGNTWNRVPLGGFNAAIIAGEYAFTNSYEVYGNTCWFLTNKSRTFRSNDAGATWEIFDNLNPATDNTPGGETCFKNTLEGLMYNADAMWNTTDGGATWTEYLPVGAVRTNEITFVPGTDNTYVSIGNEVGNTTVSTQRGTSMSTDGGVTWDNINSLGDAVNVNGGSSVQFFDMSTGFASGFNASSTVDGIFKYVGTQFLASQTFSNDNAFKASPNPTTGVVALTGKNIANVIVTDVLGKQVSNTNYTSLSTINLDLTAANAGVYMVKVTNNEGNVSTLKVVKQ
jgi:photosystem II stability/assembly factor-like uncharacterized protein